GAGQDAENQEGGKPEEEAEGSDEQDSATKQQQQQQKPQWPNGRQALRSLSEELTDMDEEALRDLEFDVDEEMTITIPGYGGGSAWEGDEDDEEEEEEEEEEEGNAAEEAEKDGAE